MSAISDLRAKCTEHVLLLRPTPDETKALKELDLELLTEDVPWPRPLANYLHRYMHYHNLYHVPKQNTSRIGNLARTLTRKAGRHVIDDLLESLCQKIASLVNASVRDWKQCGMLVATGGSGGGWLRKSPTLKEVWDQYKDAFQLLELQCNWASEDDSGKTGFSRWPKRTADSCVSGDVKRARVHQNPGSSERRHGAVPSDTIVVDDPIGSPTTLPSSHRSSCSGTRADPCEPAQTAHAQLIHEAQAAVAALHDTERQGQDTRPDTRTADAPQCHASVPAHLDSGTTTAGDIAARSTIVSVEGLLTSDVSPRTHQAGPNITVPALREVPTESRVSYCAPSPRRPPGGGLAATLEHAAATSPAMHMHRPQGEAQFVSRKLREVGQLLLPRRGVAGLWRVDVDVLMQRDAPNFFDYCGWFMGLPRISRLRVKLPDISLQETLFLDRDDSVAFDALKQIVLQQLLRLLKLRPGLQCFKIEMVAVHGSRYETRGYPTQLGTGNRPRALGPTATAAQPTVRAHLPRRSAPYVHARSNGPSALQTHVVVRTRQGEYGGFSCRYQGTILGQGVTSAYFFSWFAGMSGYHDPLGPFELEFYFKDALPPKTVVIARGNEAYFQSMKQSIPLACAQTAAQVPDLFEFAILVTAPGWTGPV